jgi:hypothetical protein
MDDTQPDTNLHCSSAEKVGSAQPDTSRPETSASNLTVIFTSPISSENGG